MEREGGEAATWSQASLSLSAGECRPLRVPTAHPPVSPVPPALYPHSALSHPPTSGMCDSVPACRSYTRTLRSQVVA